jgi:hypothetical protein
MTLDEFPSLVATVERLTVNLTDFNVLHFGPSDSRDKSAAKAALRDERRRRRRIEQMAEKIVRCPHCVLGDQFMPMLKRPAWYVCEHCGHTLLPDDPRVQVLLSQVPGQEPGGVTPCQPTKNYALALPG